MATISPMPLRQSKRLETNTRSELNVAGEVVLLYGQRAEQWIGKAGVRAAEYGGVISVKCFAPEFEADPLAQIESLDDGHVELWTGGVADPWEPAAAFAEREGRTLQDYWSALRQRPEKKWRSSNF